MSETGMSYERDYDLALLIILIVLCWPAGLIYYFTRPMRPKRYYVGPPPYQQPVTAGPPAYCRNCGAQVPASSGYCPNCGNKIW